MTPALLFSHHCVTCILRDLFRLFTSPAHAEACLSAIQICRSCVELPQVRRSSHGLFGGLTHWNYSLSPWEEEGITDCQIPWVTRITLCAMRIFGINCFFRWTKRCIAFSRWSSPWSVLRGTHLPLPRERPPSLQLA